jgi:hypothetical protein
MIRSSRDSDNQGAISAVLVGFFEREYRIDETSGVIA